MVDQINFLKSLNISTRRLQAKNIKSRNIIGGNANSKINNVFLNSIASLNFKPSIIKRNTTFGKLSANTAVNHLIIPENGIDITIKNNIKIGTRYHFDIIKSKNKFVKISNTFTKSNDTYSTNFYISKLMFTNDTDITVKFTLNMKYVGLFKPCNSEYNTNVTGTFVVTKNNDTDYVISSYTINDVNYDANDFCNTGNCGENFSYYYAYDVPCDQELDVGVDDEYQSETNIYNKVIEMFKNYSLNIGTDDITVTFDLDDFHGKIQPYPEIIAVYTNTTPLSPLKFIFDENIKVIAVKTGPNEIIPVAISSLNTINMKFPTAGDTIDIDFINFISAANKRGTLVVKLSMYNNVM